MLRSDATGFGVDSESLVDAPVNEALADSIPVSDPPAGTSGRDRHRIDPPPTAAALAKIAPRAARQRLAVCHPRPPSPPGRVTRRGCRL